MTARAEGARLALRRLLPCLLLLCLLLPCLLLPAAGAPAQTPVPEMAPRMAPQPAPSVPDQALPQAARTNDVDLAAFALERGAGLELRDPLGTTPDRKRVVKGTGVSVRVDLGGRRISIKKNEKIRRQYQN